MSCSQASDRPFCPDFLLYVKLGGDGSSVKMRIVLRPWLGIACLTSALAASAAGQDQQQIDWCNANDGVAVDQVISGCTAVIQSGEQSPKDLSTAFNNRGNAYYAMKDYDRAIADFSEAIRIDPKFAVAFYNRSCAYRDKGDGERSIDDYIESIRLDPSLK
jgi:tetratricopeptide (TPR) repeat protein